MKTSIRLSRGIAVLCFSILMIGAVHRLAAQTIYTAYHFITIAGAAGINGSADGVGSAARFYSPTGVAVDSSGNLYVSDSNNDTIRKITPTVAGGVTTWSVSTLAGQVGVAGTADGTGAGAQFITPNGIYVQNGTIYVGQGGGLNALLLRVITPGGSVTSFPAGNTEYPANVNQLFYLAGGGGVIGKNGNITTYAIGPNGNQYMSGQGSAAQNNTITEYPSSPSSVVDANGPTLLNIIAGGDAVGSADGPMGNSSANLIRGLAVDENNNVYFTDAGNQLLRKVTRTVTGGVESWSTTTLAGVALNSGSSDGTGAAARFDEPSGLAVDSSENVYVADRGNDTIRMGIPDTGPVAGNATVHAVFGQPITFTLPATDSFGDPITFAITGATGGTATLAGSQATYTASSAGTGTVNYTASDGYVTNTGAVTILTIPAQPEITLQAVSQTVATGHTAVFNASATGYPVPSYQWTLNGSATIPGAVVTDDSVLMVTGATAADAGNYVCTATNTQGTATTSAMLTVATTGMPGYLVNLSARADVLTGGNLLIVGLGIAGGGTEPMLIRGDGPSVVAVAPSLAGQLLPNPALTLFDNHSQPIVSDTGWGNALIAGSSTASVSPVPATTALFTNVGAFNFLSGTSPDSALEFTAASGGYTAEVIDANGATGIALAEIYDAGPGTSARLVNLSARADVGAGGNILIGGFNIGGSTGETVLIRGDGPALALAPFSLSNYLTQPTLSIYSGSTVIYSNGGWGNDSTIGSTFDTVGAFHLASGSADCALLVTLPPGGYTVEVSGANGTSGVALVEIYEVP